MNKNSALSLALILVSLCYSLVVAGTKGFFPSVSSFLGSSSDEDAFYSSAILSDGTIVLGGVLGDISEQHEDITCLNGTIPSSQGVIIRLHADGREILSVTTIGNYVVDISTDTDDNIYCAAMDSGIVILNKYADTILWSQTFDKPVHRVDAGASGYFAVLTSQTGNFLTQKIHSAAIYVYNPQKQQLGSFGGQSNFTRDVCIDESTQTVVTLGFRNYTTDGQPVDVPGYIGRRYDGTVKYRGYDYAANILNTNGSNMADARGQRCTFGPDGFLYLVFEVDGGNFVFDNDPKDVMQNVSWVKGDIYNQSYNTKTDPSLFYGRYNAQTGDYINGQFFTARLATGLSNTVRIVNGDMTVDTEGNMYLTGISASGMPFDFDPCGGYSGGAYVLLVKSDFSERLLCTRYNKGYAHSVSVQKNNDGSQKILWCGSVSTGNQYDLFTINPIQTSIASDQDGFYAIIPSSKGNTANTPPVSDLRYQQQIGTTIGFDASGSSDPDGEQLAYIWSFGDANSWAYTQRASHTYPNPIEHDFLMTLIVYDTRGGWDQQSLFFGPPNARFTVSPMSGKVPLSLTFSGSPTTDANDSLSALHWNWSMESDVKHTGLTVTHTFTQPGLYKPSLTVTDNTAGVSTWYQYILVAEDESKAFRFDFGSTDEKYIASGFTGVDTAQYTNQRGYGWKTSSTDRKPSRWSYHNNLHCDAVQFNKYSDKTNRMDGEFLVDLPNGVYTVLMDFMFKYTLSFPGVTVERDIEVDTVRISGVADGSGVFQSNTCVVEVLDGQMNFVFHRKDNTHGQYFISGIQIIPGAYEEPVNIARFLKPVNVNTRGLPKRGNLYWYNLQGRRLHAVLNATTEETWFQAGSQHVPNQLQIIQHTSGDNVIIEKRLHLR